MRVFIFSCLFVAAIALGAAGILDTFVQESATSAFAESSART